MAISLGNPALMVGSGHQAAPTAPVDVAVGIDLGTTNSLIAVVGPDGKPRILSGNDGPMVPSVIAFGDDGRPERVGVRADRELAERSDRTVYSIKRLMGRSAAEVADELKLLPYHVFTEPGSSAVRVEVAGQRYTPPELSAFVLRELKTRAEAALGQVVKRAVITVPAYFTDAQRQATKDAGRLAGLEVLRIVNEPTAAALAYGLDKRPQGKVAVYDLGGGTFDVSILHMHEGLTEVLATGGDTHLGGDDLDQALLSVLVQGLVASGLDVRSDSRLLQRLRKACIALKIALSDDETATVEVDLTPIGPARQPLAMDRDQFEVLIAPFVERTLQACLRALRDADVQTAELDEVVLVGGSTRIPYVRRKVAELFGREPHGEIDPDQVVALGAAVQADILTTGRRDMLLLDVTPLSLGLETMGGAVSKLILRNSTIPASASEEFTTSADLQTGVVIHVVQGERELVGDCRSLARFVIPIEPMPAGLARVAVTFLIDANGILHVTARDVRTGLEKTLEVKPSYGLTDAEVETMLEEAFDRAEEDVMRRQFVDQCTEAEQVLAATDKQLRGPAGSRLDAEEREDVLAAMASTRAAMKTGQLEVLRKAVQELGDATLHLAELGFAAALNTAAHSDTFARNLPAEFDPASVKVAHT
jgi:Fe-S protein assembly chaperone HscA